jgi:hypothetical protein
MTRTLPADQDCMVIAAQTNASSPDAAFARAVL